MKRTAIVLGALALAAAGTMAVSGVASAHGLRGMLGAGKGAFDTKLAETLGITQDELQRAREEALAGVLDDAVAAGRLTQEQADNRMAMFRLKGAIDPQALMAEALGISTEELQAARDEGETLKDLAKELGIDAETMRGNVKEAWSNALDQAVEDGVITQEQADDLASGGFLGHHRGLWRHGRRLGRGGHGGWFGPGRGGWFGPGHGSPGDPVPDAEPVGSGL